MNALLFIGAWAYVLFAPFTKVEESFNLHATHDTLIYGVLPSALRQYDHFVFPGVVPRTFLGSVLLAWLTAPVVFVANRFHLVQSKFDLQILVRLVLATVNAYGLRAISHTVSQRFGRNTSIFFVLLTCTQFHLLFWMGRTLPNMFALFPVNIATSYLLAAHQPFPSKRKPTPDVSSKSRLNAPNSRVLKAAIALLTFTSVVFRAELVLLLIPLTIQALILRQISLSSTIKTGLLSGLTAIALTVAVDSYFWSRFPLWPELAGIWFNVYEGKSSEWGTSPAHAYFTSHLPKLLLSSLPLSVVGLFAAFNSRSGMVAFIIPFITFVGLISGLGHKEWRFIIYVVPPMNVVAAVGASWMVSPRKRFIMRLFLTSVLVCLLVGNILFTTLLALASRSNYPGGEAMLRFHQLHHGGSKTNHDPIATDQNVRVHISNLAAQTGASLFLHLNGPPNVPAYLLSPGLAGPALRWSYDKTENLDFFSGTRVCPAYKNVTHLISETPPPLRTPSENGGPSVDKQWKVIDIVEGFDGWRISGAVGLVKGLVRIQSLEELREAIAGALQMKKREMLWILERV